MQHIIFGVALLIVWEMVWFGWYSCDKKSLRKLSSASVFLSTLDEMVLSHGYINSAKSIIATFQTSNKQPSPNQKHFNTWWLVSRNNEENRKFTRFNEQTVTLAKILTLELAADILNIVRTLEPRTVFSIPGHQTTWNFDSENTMTAVTFRSLDTNNNFFLCMSWRQNRPPS